MKFRLLVVGGAVAALSTLSLTANAAGPNSGDCASTSAPAASGQTVGLPDGGTVYAGGTQAPPQGSAGIQGPHGYLDGSGGQSSGGGTISGYQTDSGLNGSLNVDSSPSLCIGVAGKGGVGVP